MRARSNVHEIWSPFVKKIINRRAVEFVDLFHRNYTTKYLNQHFLIFVLCKRNRSNCHQFKYTVSCVESNSWFDFKGWATRPIIILFIPLQDSCEPTVTAVVPIMRSISVLRGHNVKSGDPWQLNYREEFGETLIRSGQLDGAEAAARAKSRGRDVGKQDRVHLCGCAPGRSAGKWSSWDNITAVCIGSRPNFKCEVFIFKLAVFVLYRVRQRGAGRFIKMVIRLL